MHLKHLDSERSEALARQLADAQKDTGLSVPATGFAEIDRDTAFQIQRRTMDLLGERAAASKIAFEPSGQPIAAPIYSGMTYGQSARVVLPKRGFLGFEVEIAVRLGATITPEMASRGAKGIMPAIAGFHVGIELVATRFEDRSAAGPYGQLADNLNTAGYVWSDVSWQRGTDIDDIKIFVEIDDDPIVITPGAHPFGGVLEPIVDYGRQQSDKFGALEAGMLVTTGALSGLIKCAKPALIRAGIMGTEPVSFSLCRES